MKRVLSGWGWVMILVGVYSILQFWGGWFEKQVGSLEAELKTLRPRLTSIARHEQLEKSKSSYQTAAQQIREISLPGVSALEALSQHLPPSLTIQQLGMGLASETIIRGTCLPGLRDPEGIVTRWASRLALADYDEGKVRLAPDPQSPGLWYFELKLIRSEPS